MEKRVIWKMLLLTIVTLGIYRVYWFIKTRREMIKLNPNVKILSPLFLILPFALIIVSIGFFMVSLFSIYSIAGKPNCQSLQTQTKSSTVNQETLPEGCRVNTPGWSTAAIYLSFLLFYPLVAIWLWGYSKGVDVITGGHTSFAIALIVLLLVPDGIDILIIQDSFNKLSESPLSASPSGPPTPIAA